MGLFGKIEQKAMGGAGKLIKYKVESTIKKLIEEKRLIYLANDRASYTNKQDIKKTISLEEMVAILVLASGEENLLNVGITADDVRNMLVEANNKLKGGK